MSKKSRQALRIALTGAGGRMGQEIAALIAADSAFAIGATINDTADWRAVAAADVDLIIDFSSPAGLKAALAWAVRTGTPLVSGTTGLTPKLRTNLAQAARKVPVLYSANMSAGVAVMSAMLEVLRGLGDWDFQIEEAHHHRKKDKPSGTALLLQDKLAQVLDRDLPPPLAIRGGGIPGIHQVWAMGEDEIVIVQHTAFNRRVFARGALYAARWLFDKKPPGLYDLTDLYKKT